MKKHPLLFIALGAILTFTSCKTEEDYPLENYEGYWQYTEKGEVNLYNNSGVLLLKDDVNRTGMMKITKITDNYLKIGNANYQVENNELIGNTTKDNYGNVTLEYAVDGTKTYKGTISKDKIEITEEGSGQWANFSLEYGEYTRKITTTYTR